MVHVYEYNMNNDPGLKYELEKLRKEPRTVILVFTESQVVFLADYLAEKRIGYKPSAKLKTSPKIRLAFNETMALRDTLLSSAREIQNATLAAWRIAGAATELQGLQEIEDEHDLLSLATKFLKLEDRLNELVDDATTLLEHKACQVYGERMQPYVGRNMIE